MQPDVSSAQKAWLEFILFSNITNKTKTQQHIKLRYDSNLENFLGRYCEEEVFLGIHWKTTLADGIDVRDCASDLAGNFLFFSRPILIAAYK